MGQEHGDHRANEDADDIDETEVLPAVVDDLDAHESDRGVHDPVELERSCEQTEQMSSRQLRLRTWWWTWWYDHIFLPPF
jgi:hypothetical protein